MASNTVAELSKRTVDLIVLDPLDDENGHSVLSLESLWARQHPSKRANGRPANRRNGPHLASINALVAEPRINHHSSAAAPTGGLIKRVIDIVIAGTALILLSPLLFTVALLIYMTMGRPVIFPQRRLGLGGRPFKCLKFRTMMHNAEGALQSHLANNSEAAREWHASQKLQRDPRITVLGHVLRRSSLDELPQLVCVLAGHMSCIGPRPIVDAEIARYGQYWSEYTRARPGMTGAWQVAGRNRLSYDRRIALDRYYVRKWSFLRDLEILIKTIPAVMRADDTA